MLLAPLPCSFYLRDTRQVARDLLGGELVCRTAEGEASGLIVETEAYLGVNDAASHAFGGRRTPRTEILFAAGGRAYVYLIYGLHHCLNLTTRETGVPECVLIRALEPLAGRELMQARRPPGREERLASGPGRLCSALGIGRELNGEDLTGGRLFVRPGRPVGEGEVMVTARIGVDYAGEARGWPLRFYVANSRSLSRK